MIVEIGMGDDTKRKGREMWYWNRDSFEGLEAFARQLSAEPKTATYGQYCALRARGLRKQSLAALRAFVAEFEGWPRDEKRTWASWIIGKQIDHHQIHQLMPQPLGDALQRVFEQWRDSTDEAEPRRWLGYLLGDVDLFRDALDKDPTDDYSRFRVVDSLIGYMEHAAHHVPDYFIGDPGEALEAYDDAKELLPGFVDARRRQVALEELDQARRKITDWRSFEQSGEQDFEAWCVRARGYRWDRSTVVYYENK